MSIMLGYRGLSGRGGKERVAAMLVPVLLACVTTCGSDRMSEGRVAGARVAVGSPSLWAMPGVAQSGEKLALIVAIAEQGQAPEGALAYERLNGPGADVVLVSAALQHHGFASDNIVVLQDAQATKDGILAALEGLVERAGPGDVAVFHYSGHGHQVRDDNGEEIDGYDEVLVPYGAPDYSEASDEVQRGYAGERHIRDDALGVLLDRLAARVGPEGSVAVFLDACFSGTGTRGAGQLGARGGKRPIGAPAHTVGGRTGEALDGGFAEVPRTRGASALDYVVISASSHDEKAFETHHTDGRTIVGTLSHALSVALPRMRTGDSYRDLHSQVVEIIRAKQPGQSPQIEGTADMEVFGNLLADYEAWVRVGSDEGEGRLVLEGGELRGLGTRSEVEIRGRAGSGDAEVVLATGTVVESSPLSSVVQLDSLTAYGDSLLARGENLTAARAFVTRESFGDLTARIMIDESVDPEVAELIRDSLSTRWIVSMTMEPDAGADGIVSQEGTGRVRLKRTHDGMPVGDAVEIVDGNGAGRLAILVESFARSEYLRKLNPHNSSIDVSLSLHPWDGDPRECREEKDATGFVDEITLSAGRAFFLKVTNHGGTNPYFAILNLMPNGAIGQLFPEPRHSSAAARLKPHGEVTLPGCWAAGLMRERSGRIVPVLGLEVLKLFATGEPVDFNPLINSSGTQHRSSRGPPHDLERLFGNTYQRARSVRVGARPAMASVSSVQIEVVGR